jgi:hypothetical protein
VQAVIDAHQAEELSPEAAEEESGYTWAHLRRLNSEGRVPFTDRGLIRRCNLPRKPGYAVQPEAPPANVIPIANTRHQPARSMTQVAASVLQRD